MARAAVLIVGDEILGGHTQDTNSHYLAGRLAARGVSVDRVLVVPDVVEDIAAELEGLMARGLDLVFVCGGIGPTPDDRTYEAVSIACQAPLEVSPEDEAWMRERVVARGYGTGLLEEPASAEALWRMVRRPSGSERIENPVGAALGSAIRTGESLILVLPGVPRELRAMMEQVVEPRFLSKAGPPSAVAEWEIVSEEARLFLLLRDLEARHPSVRFGSYPQDDRGRVLLRIKGPAADVEQAVAALSVGLAGRGRRVK